MRKARPGWAVPLALTFLSVSGLALPRARADVPGAGADASEKKALAGVPSLACEQYQLKNGLTVILSHDPTLPIVATEMVYLVGSGHEHKGKTGFAHLFEHLMFQGSLHHDSEFFAPFEPIGGEVNGTTNADRTNYYEHVPSEYAELTLWMESDRMRSLLPVLTQQKLDNQRDVVKNERRQRYEMSPYGMDHWYLSKALYPPEHPYHHDTIGSHEDLTNANLEDVQAFFRQYYVPANAALIMAGDFDPGRAKAWIEKYFADIPGGERAKAPSAAPPSPSRKHWVIEDAVQLPRVYLAFHSPALMAKGDAELDLLAGILSDGKTSRLYQALVYGRKLAKDVTAYQISRKLSGMFVIEATLAPGVTLDEFGPALDEEVAKALATLPSDAELERVRSGFKKDFYHRIESVGDRASLLGSYFLQTGVANQLAEDYRRYERATPESVHAAGHDFLMGPARIRLDFIPGTRGKPPRDLSSPSGAAGGPR